jgi:shikimate kinase
LGAAPSRPHIILVGLPGAGKSTVGRRVARRLGRRFLDFDHEIERREGMSIAELFAKRGEPYFRLLEIELTRELVDTGGMLLSPGGGWIMNDGALGLLRPPAGMIYLHLSPEVALRRMRRGRAKRPLLAGPDPLAALRRLLAAREPLYRTADHVVSVETFKPQQVIEEVTRLASAF